MSGPTFDNRRARFAGGPRTASKKLSHIRRAAATRKVVSGYPIETPFTSPEDVHDYLNGDVITCLRCGKPYKALGCHLQVHGWWEEKYKEFYGLPWRTGLTSKKTKRLKTENGKINLRRGVAFGGILGDSETIEKAHRAPRRKRAKYLTVVSIMNGNKNRKRNQVQTENGRFLIWKEEDYYKTLDHMKTQDRTLAQTCVNEELPSEGAVYNYAKEHEAFAKALEETWEKLSFSTQAKAERLGSRFLKEANNLREEGLSYRGIGDILGVTTMTVFRHISKNC